MPLSCALTYLIICFVSCRTFIGFVKMLKLWPAFEIIRGKCNRFCKNKVANRGRFFDCYAVGGSSVVQVLSVTELG